MYQLTKGKIPIIGVGGVSNAQDAFDKIAHGATLIQVTFALSSFLYLFSISFLFSFDSCFSYLCFLQIYTAFGYEGPAIVNDIRKDLVTLLKEKGFKNVKEAVGSHYRTPH